MATKYYFRSSDTSRNREVAIHAESVYAAMIRLWQRELELLRAIPASSIPLWDVSAMMFDPELVCHRGQIEHAVEIPTAPILAAFDDEDRSLITVIMAENWALDFERFYEDSKFFN
jgi:hypothetical protein